jgi:hypothetical protein
VCECDYSAVCERLEELETEVIHIVNRLTFLENALNEKGVYESTCN